MVNETNRRATKPFCRAHEESLKPSLPSDAPDDALHRRDHHKGDKMAFTASALRHGKLLAATAFTLGLLTS
ncbi:hypothetical protein, partial [Klebsiella pneumoniae]|uniref:hypothetical protein n=1 Tax=Klebsiella pneumoniae TaxID=573 RepID=UPI003B985C0D